MSGDEQNRDEQVRQRAYELWEQAGRPDGRDDEFWHQAWAEDTQDVGGASTAEDNISPLGAALIKPGTQNSAKSPKRGLK